MAVLRDVPVVHTLDKGVLYSQNVTPFWRYTVLCNFIYTQNQITTFPELIFAKLTAAKLCSIMCISPVANCTQIPSVR
jgi:hypothetical protein